MKLPGSVFIYEFLKTFDVEFNVESRRLFGMPYYSCLEDHPLSMYVTNNIHEIKHIRDDSLYIICNNEILDFYPKNYIMVNADVTTVFNEISKIMNHYEEIDRRFLEIYAEGKGINCLIREAANAYGNMINLVDSTFHIISCHECENTPVLESMKRNQSMDEFFNTGSLSSSDVADLKDMFNENLRNKQATEAIMPGNQFKTIYANIYEDKSYKASLCMIPYHRDLGDQDYYFIEHLSYYAQLILKQSRKKSESQLDTIRTNLIQIINGIEIDEQLILELLRNIGFKNNLFRWITIEKDKEETEIIINYIIEKIANNITSFVYLTLENEIIFLIDDEQNNINNLIIQISDIIKQFNLKCGISENFNGVNQIKNYYMQSSEMLHFVLENHFDLQFVYLFEDYRLQYMIKNSCGRLTPHTLYTEGFKKLIEHDRKSPVSYIETLNCYFQNNITAAKTARQLFIQRNSLLTRLSNIEKLLNMDFNSSDDRFLIELQLRNYISQSKPIFYRFQQE